MLFFVKVYCCSHLTKQSGFYQLFLFKFVFYKNYQVIGLKPFICFIDRCPYASDYL